MYLLFLTFGLCIAYLGLFFLFPFFFKNKIARISKKSFYSIALTACLSLAGYIVGFHIPDLELGNRFQHAFGGGFLAFLICFLVVKDSGLVISKFQFFIFSALLVTALGVVNELLEFFLQNYTSLGILFSSSINDTWLDLTSNAAGILIASACFVPFVNRRK